MSLESQHHVQDFPGNHLPEAVRFLLSSEPADRHPIVESTLGPSLLPNRDPTAICRGIIANGTLEGAYAAKIIGGSAALLLAAHASPATDSSIARALWHDLHAQMANRDIRFIQAMRDGELPPSLLEQWDFTRLVRLDYYTVPPHVAAGRIAEQRNRATETAAISNDAVEMIPAADVNPDELRHLVEETYVDSQDCPTFSQYRTVAEVLESYRAAPGFRLDLWSVLRLRDGRLAGCLFLTQHAEAKITEITYMGVHYSHRKKGYGWVVLDQSVGEALRLGSEQLVLAVDRANQRAVNLYERVGMCRFFSESVWVRSLQKTGADASP